MSNDRQYSDLSPFMFSNWAYLEPMRKHASFIYVFIVSAILTALALTYIYSEKYEAMTTIIFSPEEITRLKFKVQESEAFGAPMPAVDFKVIGKTLQELATSERLLRDVVAQFGLDEVEEKVYTGPWYIRYYEMFKDYGKEYAIKAWTFLKYGRLPDENLTAEAVEELADQIEITNQDSYVFILTVRDRYPERVALIADALAQGLVEMLEQDDIGVAGDKLKQLETLLAKKEGEIAGYREEIRSLLDSHKMTSVSREIERGLEQLYGFVSERTVLEAEIEQNKRKIASLDAKLTLKGGVAGRSTGESRRVAALNPRSAGQGGRAVDSSRGRIQPEDFKQMASDKVFTEIKVDGLRARHASLQASISELEAWLRDLPAVELRIDQLETDLDRANEEYGMLSVALQELAVRKVEVQSELKIQHAATVPTAPVSPIKIYHVGLAALLGPFLVVGLVYVFSYFNIRFFMPSRGVKGREQRAPATEGDSHSRRRGERMRA